jgi:very-short-patch-repair endonuclease
MSDPLKPTAMRQSPAQARVRDAQLSKTDTSATRTIPLIDGRRITIAASAPVDARIESIASEQHTRVARSQLLLAGVDNCSIQRRLRNGGLVRVHSGVYGLPHTAEVPLADEAAAVLACGPQAALSHHSAATLRKLRPGSARPVHLTTLGSSSGPRLNGVVLHRSRTLNPKDIGILHGLPVTSTARTLLDVAAALPDRDIERLLDEALLAQRLVTLTEIGELLARAGRHPGRARLARVAGAYSGSTRTESPPEETLLLLIRAAGLPKPRPQVWLLGYRVDFYWPELKLAVEVDAYGTHGSRARFEEDRRRDARLLTELQIVVLRLTKAMIEQRPYEAIGLLARAIGQREAALGARAA